VELIMAITLLSVSLIGLSSFSLFSARSLHSSKAKSLATVIAREEIDNLRTVLFDSLWVGIASDTVAIGSWTFTVVTEIGLQTSKLKTIDVTIVDSNNREVQHFGTLLGDNR
jgi:hypothetical protein